MAGVGGRPLPGLRCVRGVQTQRNPAAVFPTAANWVPAPGSGIQDDHVGGKRMSANASLAVLDRATTANGVSEVAPAATTRGSLVAGRVLPTRTELATVLPWPGLRHGSTVAVHDSTALLLALLSEATTQGSWSALVGLPGIGLTAAAETGVDIARLALVPHPGNNPAEVIAALLDGVDLVVVGQPQQLTDTDARRLSTRARHRGSVLLPLGSWPGADVQLHCTEAHWHGLGDGHGHLRERELTIRASGRGAAARPRTHRLLLPGPGGPVAPAEAAPAEVTPVRPATTRTGLAPAAGWTPTEIAARTQKHRPDDEQHATVLPLEGSSRPERSSRPAAGSPIAGSHVAASSGGS